MNDLRYLYKDIIDSLNFWEQKIDHHTIPLSRADFDYERKKKSGINKSFEEFISQQFAAINANKFEAFFKRHNE